MDSTILTNSGAPLITPWSARGMSNEKFLALQKADAHKRELQADVAKAMDSPSFKVKNDTKNRIRQKLQEIAKRLKILKKLFAGNPKEMAKALKGVFKELRAALKEYKAAMKDEMGMSASAAAGVVPPEAATADASMAQADTSDKKEAKDGEDAAKDDTDEARTETTEADGAKTDADATQKDGAPDDGTKTNSGDPTETAKPTGTVSYGEVVGAMRQSIGEDGMKFVKELVEFVKTIEDKLLTPARNQMKMQKPNKDMDKAFEEVEKELKELKQDMQDMQDDIKKDVPTVGMRLDIAA